MRAVTPKYWWKRQHGVFSLLPSWARRELFRNGYLTLPRPWEMSPRRAFSISRWLSPDGSGGDYGRYDEPMPRYSETLDFPMNVWDAVRHPWEDDQVVPVECLHTEEERRKYLSRKLDDAYSVLKHGKATVMYIPYGGLPIVSVASVDGKVKIL